MSDREISWCMFLLWILFFMLLSLTYMFKRLSVRRKGTFYFWPPVVYRSYKRRLLRRYCKTLGWSVIVAAAATFIWHNAIQL